MLLRPPLRSSRPVLFVGFGGLLAILALMAWKSAQLMASVEPENSRVRAAWRQRDELLDAIRLNLSESASEVRDYLLDPNAADAAPRRAALQALRARVEQAAASYGRGLSPEEAPAWRQLNERLTAYWMALDPIFRWDADARLQRAGPFLREVVLPRHRELLLLADLANRADERNFQLSESNLALMFAQFRREMAVSAAVAIALGAVLAFVAMRRILELERMSQVRLNEVAAARAEMQNLSKRLVAVQEEERRRVARELHDEVGQAISAVLVELGRLENRIPGGAGEQRAMLAGAKELADRAVNQVRDMALLLRPSMLDDLGLAPALKWQAREISRRTGIKVKVAAEESADELPDEYRTCIYRVVQEALNNAARHAQASSVRVDLRRAEEGVRVSIQDDGAGFDPSQERGMGILGMEERVKSLGGLFRIDSSKGGGSIVSLLLPLDKAAAGDATA